MMKTKNSVVVANAATSQRRIGPVLATGMLVVLGLGGFLALIPRDPELPGAAAQSRRGEARAASSIDHLSRFGAIVPPSAGEKLDLSQSGLSEADRDRFQSDLSEEFDLVNPGPPIQLEMVVSSKRGLVEAHVRQMNRQVDWVGDEKGAWSRRNRDPEMVADTLKIARGPISGSLYLSAIESGADARAAGQAVKALAERTDLDRELAQGGQFILGYEADTRTQNCLARFIRVIRKDGSAVQLFRFKDARGSWKWVDANGRGGGQAMLRTPVDATRISSGFGMRLHPLLGYSRMHQGIDFAAPTGTAVVAAGDGTIVRAGWDGGYGRLIQIRHSHGWSSQYGHLSALNVHAGQVVRQGQLIGRVGSTGISTGPHLHFELRLAGRPVDPAGQSRLYQPVQSADPEDIAILRTRLAAAVRRTPAS